MGLAVLPSRLKAELAALGEAIVSCADISADEVLAKHAEWAAEIKAKHKNLTAENIDDVLREETGLVFSTVLEHAGVYKRDEQGKAAFMSFVEEVNRT